MDKILLLSEEPEKWRDFASALSGHYDFILAKNKENSDFAQANLIAVDEISAIANIPEADRARIPVIFFGPANAFSTEVQARKNGASEYFSIPFDKELILLRLSNISKMSRLIRANSDDLRWMRMIRREMMSMQEGMTEIMAQMVESRDENTGGHVTRTATFISILGDEFVEDGTLDREQLNLIVMATPLHDIGKIAVRDSVLLKPGPLTDSERLEMMSHPSKGAALIKKMQRRFESLSYLKYAYDIAMYHHERFDGNGYPNGKKGDEIPFWARMMAVVDVYDALISDRVYRKGMPKEKAYDIIFSGSDTQFDPIVLKAFDKCKDYLL